MRCKAHFWFATVASAIVSLSSASTAIGRPFDPLTADIQSLIDVTSSFHSGQQLSTIDAIRFAPAAIRLDVTWRVGQLDDASSPFYGTTIPRVSLAKYVNNEDGGLGRLLFPGLDGIRWRISTDHDSYVQPFVQTAPNWTFYEPIPIGNTIAGDLNGQWSAILFDNAQNYSGITPNTIVHPDGNGEIRVNAFGLQFGGPAGLVPGQELQGHIMIFDWNVEPEPSTAILMVMGVAGLLSQARRSRL